MISKLLKYGIYSCFIGIITWCTIQFAKIMWIFPDWRINTLGISCIVFIIIIAIKRGVWH